MVYVAHACACEVGIIHRDISEGNMLIRIDEVVDENTGEVVRTYHGILADWELSTAFNKDDLKEHRSVDRTVRNMYHQTLD